MSSYTIESIYLDNEAKRKNRAKVNTTITVSQDILAKAEFIAKHSDANSATSVMSGVVEHMMLDFIRTFRNTVPDDKKASFDNELIKTLNLKEFEKFYSLTPSEAVQFANVIIFSTPENDVLQDERHRFSTVYSGIIVERTCNSVSAEYRDRNGEIKIQTFLFENVDWEDYEYISTEDGERYQFELIMSKPISKDDSPTLSLSLEGGVFSIDGYYMQCWETDTIDMGLDVSKAVVPFEITDISGFVRTGHQISLRPSLLELEHIEGNKYSTCGHTIEFFDSCILVPELDGE